MKTLIIRHLGLHDYQPVFDAMRDFTTQRDANTCDEVWLLQHPHVFTQGKAGKAEHVLNPGDVPIVQTDRGGQVTYHGPGQLIIYPLFDLRRLKLGVKKFVTTLEQVIIDLLAEYGIAAQASDTAPGVYIKVTNAKICSLGLRIQHGCSYHGLALNVTTNLNYFKRINPCGVKNLHLINIADLFKPTPTMNEIIGKLSILFQQKFAYTATEILND
jgi:lipoyl(octanoyl) transferase